MRAGVIIFGFVLASCSSASPRIESIRNAVIAGLSWHYRWIEAVPLDSSSLKCSIGVFERKSFAYCEPVRLSVDIETSEEGRFHVVNILHENSDFEAALTSFQTNRNPGQSLEPVQELSIPLQTLGTCKVDWKRTEQAATIAVSKQHRTELQKKGIRLRYPVICEGDPFYLVYFMRDEKIEWIWQFEISPTALNLIWSFDAGTQQRKIPELAAENLNKDGLWYELVK